MKKNFVGIKGLRLKSLEGLSLTENCTEKDDIGEIYECME